MPWLHRRPCSPAWFPLHVQIHVFISNKGGSHCDEFSWCSDALIRSLAGRQLHQQTVYLSPFSGDKRPHPCHRAMAAIDYHHSFSLAFLPRPSSASLSFHFSFSSHAFPLSIWTHGDKSFMSLLQWTHCFKAAAIKRCFCRFNSRIIQHPFYKVLVWRDGLNDLASVSFLL